MWRSKTLYLFINLALREIITMSKKLLLLFEYNYLKIGFYNGIQRYKCASCGRKFSIDLRINPDKLLHDYIQGNQTYQQLATQNN